LFELGTAFSILGFGVLAFRLGPSVLAVLRGSSGSILKPSVPGAAHFVSIIVPARNEETNLPKLLTSLTLIEQEKVEILIVDDNSEDRTREIVEDFSARDSRVRLIKGSVRPQGWTGKNWACLQGAHEAKGEWFLFTDADTEHTPMSLTKALYKCESESLDMMSAVPYHDNSTLFEKLMGPFHLLVFISSSAFSKPRSHALFAIGQYLLFKKDFYLKQGTHEAVKMSFSDDLDLAEQCLKHGGCYGLETSGTIFKVRMYPSFAAFMEGWKRIFRIGFVHARFWRVIEIFLIISCLTESFHFAKASRAEAVLALGGLVLIAFAQRRYGRFSVGGVLLAPLGIGTFVYLSASALLDRIRGRDLRWRGRSYKLTS
jgi:chlorobactene glucosyltransferase